MPYSRLLAIELALVIGAGVVLLLLLNPFGSSGGIDGREEAAAASPAATSTPLAVKALPDNCGPAVDSGFLASNQIISYYGNPYVPAMGILGELEPEELVADLKARAQAYDDLNGFTGVQPALHLVYGTAQHDPGREGKYLLYVDDTTMKQYIDLACANRMLIFIDLQIGRSDVRTEVTKVLPWLLQSHVHLALDPEFAVPPGEVPGEHIGSLDAADINVAQDILEKFTQDQNLPDKVLIVHQFLDEMITHRELLKQEPRVKLVIDMDGFGAAEIKVVKFGWYAAPAKYSAIKLFFKQDPDLMSEADVLALHPNVIIYQ